MKYPVKIGLFFRHWICCFGSSRRVFYFILCAFVIGVLFGSYRSSLNQFSFYPVGRAGLVTVSYGINMPINQLLNSTIENQHNETTNLSTSAFTTDSPSTTTLLTSSITTNSPSTTTPLMSAITTDSPLTTTLSTSAITTDSPLTTTLSTSSMITNGPSMTTLPTSAIITDGPSMTTFSTSAIITDGPSTTTPLMSEITIDSPSTTTLLTSKFSTGRPSTVTPSTSGIITNSPLTTTLSTSAISTDSPSTTTLLTIEITTNGPSTPTVLTSAISTASPSMTTPLMSAITTDRPLTTTLSESKFTTNSPLADRNWSRYIVDTPTCRIPSFDPRDPEVVDAVVDNLDKIECGNPPLTSIINRQFIINLNNIDHYGVKELKEMSCCYQIITRDQDGKSDNKFKYSKKCEGIDNGTFIEDEFIRVQCSIHQNSLTVVQFHVIIPLINSTYDEVETYSDHPDRFSVMAIGFDSTSRLNFQRHMSKTRKYLLETMGAVEMFGYTKAGDNTFPNLVPVLTGLSSDQIEGSCWKAKGPLDNCTWIWQTYKENDYITLYGEDNVYLSTFNYLKQGFLHQPTDYYLRPFLIAAEKETAHNRFYNTKLCLSPRPLHEVILNWGKQFMETMTNVSYFGFVWSNSLTHDEPNHIQLADGYTFDTLKDLYSNGHLDRTILLMISDHGMRWGSIRHTIIGQYENRLPALYVYVPELFQKRFPNYYQNLQTNSHRITSPYDIHQTFIDILRLQTSSNNTVADSSEDAIGISLFNEIDENRTCQDAGIDNEWCACDEIVKVDPNDSLVITMGAFIVDTINSVTAEVRYKCAKLSLKSVCNAGRQMNPHLRDEDPDEHHYRVAVAVEPSGGIFEATVIYRNSTGITETVDGDITRMNLYGNQSYCVDDIAYKSFCYCQL